MGLTKKQHHTCRSFCFMYSHILFTAPARDNEFSPVPKNFTRASESGRQARSPELPFFCFFPLLFGSSESEQWRVKTILLSQDCKCTDFFINILTWVGCSSTQHLQNSVIYTKETFLTHWVYTTQTWTFSPSSSSSCLHCFSFCKESSRTPKIQKTIHSTIKLSSQTLC